MAEKILQQENTSEPRGFGQHSRGLSGEYAHEQGWGLNIGERRRQSMQPQNIDGGTDYDYGGQDFGDEPVNTQIEPEDPAGEGHKVMTDSKEIPMSKTHSRANEMAMKDMDRHSTGEKSSVPIGGSKNQGVRAHTKPVGDLRNVEMKEESNRRISRMDQSRVGNKNR
jgi:hypothetical protein